MNTRKKSMLMLAVGALIIVMAVGYAAASTMLSITGTANVNATWNVAITGVDEGTATGSAKNNSTPSFTGTTASFDFTFLKPGDEIQYNVTITNNGTMDAYLASIGRTYTGSTDTTKTTTGIDGLSMYTKGIKQSEVIKAGEAKIVTIVYRLDNSEILNSEPTLNKIGVSMNFQQSNKATTKTYKTNDIVVLTDDNKYRVLKDNEDTITVIRETPIDNLSIYDSTYSVEGVKNYLNTTYKESLDTELSDKIVGNIEVPNYINYDDSSKIANDTKYISEFLNDVISTCYKYQGTANSQKNCDLRWLYGENDTLTNSNAGAAAITTNLDDTYMIVNGTYSTANDGCAEGTGIEFNNQKPIVGSFFKLDISNNNIASIPTNILYVENEKIYKSGRICNNNFSEYSPEHLYLYPVMTVKKSAIK